ncbi:hypothetical protein [Neobacillus rhizosphaerae]|uniref:hypothetical protein n=1 Tax=Neobacillus rhizosphaerae TaxID=2880965 RepID=UPI00201081BB|nr:hypothetical protein [Neobacillus rhizosphaerae]
MKNAAYIVEAIPDGIGVRSYANNWGTRYTSKKKMYVSGATQRKYKIGVFFYKKTQLWNG